MSLTASSSINTAYTIVPSDPSDDRRIYGINVTNTLASNHVASTVWLSDGTSDYQMGLITIPANAGNTNAIPSVDLFTNSEFRGLFTHAMADEMGEYYFNLPKGWSIKFTYTNTLTTNTALTFAAFGEVYGGSTMNLTWQEIDITKSITNANGTNSVDLVESSASDRRIYGIGLTSTDTTARTLAIRLSDGTNNYLIYTVSALANAGNSATIASQDIFYENFITGLFGRTSDAEGATKYFNLPAGWSINCTRAVAVAVGSLINVKIIGEIYG